MKPTISRLALALALATSAGCAQAPAADSGGPATRVDAGGPPSRWNGEPAASDASERVLLLSIDGLHAQDLQRYTADNTQSTLARLGAIGTRYDAARAPFPSDSFPSVLAWATGSTPRGTGVFYDLSYDRSLSPAGSDCSQRGARVDFSDQADLDAAKSDGGGALDPARLPRDPARDCAPVYPHDYLRVNTLFEVAQQAGKRTAWSDKHLSYEVLQGPSGMGVDDLFDPEIAAVDTSSAAAVEAYDASKLQAVVHQIEGRDHAGEPAEVPTIFGMNFQAVSVAQKSYGYMDAGGTPTPELRRALDSVDAAVARLVDALWAHDLWRSTTLVLLASHGQSPIDPGALQRVSASVIPDLVNEAAPGSLAAATQDSVCLLWLKDPAQVNAVADHLIEQRERARIDRLLVGDELASMFGDPRVDPRVPDIIVVPRAGTIYTDSKKKRAEHGGFSDDDRHVGLLWVGSGARGRVVASSVETRQVAQTVLKTLGLDPDRLTATRSEPIPPLPEQ